jgi:hypothetical protein
MSLPFTKDSEISETTAPPDPEGSLVESAREERLREADSKALKAAQEAQRAERSKNIKKIVKFSILSLVGAGVVIGGVFATISIISANSSPSGGGSSSGNNDPENPKGPALGVIEGYQCKTTICEKAADLPDGRILVRDTAYYIYNPADTGSVRTTIDSVSFRTIEPFMWKDLILVTLEQTTNQMGLYSITHNRKLSQEYIYASIATDINDPIYKGFEWIEGSYIIAKRPEGEVRLINTLTGAEILRATKKIFCLPRFFFGYETNGDRRAYTITGTRILSAPADRFLAVTADNYLVHVLTGDRSFHMYDTSGNRLASNDEPLRQLQRTLNEARNQDYPVTLRTLPGIVVVPD